MTLLDNQNEIDNNILEREEKKAPVIEYWINAPRLQADISVEWGWGWWNIKVKNFSFPTNTTWDLAITWIWFTPKYVSIICNSTLSTSQCSGSSDIVTQWCIFNHQKSPASNGVSYWYSSTKLVHIEYIDAWTQRLRADVKSFDADWLTLDMVENSWAFIINATITCYA